MSDETKTQKMESADDMKDENVEVNHDGNVKVVSGNHWNCMEFPVTYWADSDRQLTFYVLISVVKYMSALHIFVTLT